jgi:SAM-dependent methyltransferase
MQRPEACNLCGATEGEVIYVADPKDLLGADLPPYPIVRCGGCGLVCAEGRKDADFLKGLYDEGYYSGRFKGGYKGYVERREEQVQKSAPKVETMERFVPRRGRVLDVGCAAGFFLEAARQAGWEACGVEHSPFSSEEARRHGLDARTGTLRDAAWPEGHFDVATFWGVVGHVNDPSGNVREAWRVLRPGGLILLHTPNQEMFSVKNKYAGAGWYRAPLQLYFFSEETLGEMLRRNGFERVQNLRARTDANVEMIGFRRGEV